MDIREIGIGSVVVVGGMAFGFSQYGLDSVLSEDLKHITEVSQAERPAYMETVTTEFQNKFEDYHIQLEAYSYEGLSTFTSSPDHGTFVETISSVAPVPKEEIKNLQKLLNEPVFREAFCQQSEMVMFTDKGWNYKFMVQDSNGRPISNIRCNVFVTTNIS